MVDVFAWFGIIVVLGIIAASLFTIYQAFKNTKK